MNYVLEGSCLKDTQAFELWLIFRNSTCVVTIFYSWLILNLTPGIIFRCNVSLEVPLRTPFMERSRFCWTVSILLLNEYFPGWSYRAKYSKMHQVKFVEDSLLKIWSDMVCPLQIFKGCLPQILLGPFLNTLPHIWHHSQDGASQVSDRFLVKWGEEESYSVSQ